MLLLLNFVKNDWKLWSSRQEAEVMRSYAQTGRKMTLFIMGKYQTHVIM